MTTANILAQLGSPGVITGFKNRIINGAMTIDQRNFGSTPISTDPVFTLDRWRNSANGGGAFSSTQSSVVPNGTFTNSLLLTVTTADSSIASGDYYSVNQVIEGYNMADFGWGTANAQAVTFSFWVRASIAGPYALALSNGSFNRAYVAPYTISSANTWQYITITVPGETTGTWEKTNSAGVYVIWNIGEGAGRQTATPNTWLTSYAGTTATSTNLIATLGATFYITGCQLEVGTTATNFDFRSITTELQLCQRYAYKRLADGSINDFAPLGQGRYYATNAAQLYVPFPVTMRTSPSSITVSGTILVNDTGFGGANWTSPVINETSCDGTTVTGSTTTGTTAGNATTFYVNGSGIAFIIFNAEL
jgi:hypothetical protein